MIEDLIFFQEKLKSRKNMCVSMQLYEYATNWRDAERTLEDVIQGTISLQLFFDHIKREKYDNFNEIYEVVKPLEITLLRKDKINKIEKLYKKT